MKTELWAVGLALLSCVIGSFGPIFLKKASASFSLNIIKMLKNKNLIIGVICYVFGILIFIPALKGGELSVLYPLVSLSYIFVSLYSIKLLNEKMNKLKWIGIITIIIGITFIGLGA